MLARFKTAVRETHTTSAMPPGELCQGARLWMSAAPCSWYSCLDIHICWNVPRDARMDPPIHVANFLCDTAGPVVSVGALVVLNCDGTS